jgi:hypothetical protein
MYYVNCQDHLSKVLAHCGRHTKLSVRFMAEVSSNDIKKFALQVRDLPCQLWKLEVSVRYDTDTNVLGAFSSIRALRLQRTAFANQRIESKHTDWHPPSSLLEYDGGQQIQSNELGRLPDTLTALGAKFLLWDTSMLRFTSLTCLKLGHAMYKRPFTILAATLIHLRHLRFFGLHEPLDADTRVSFPALTKLHQRSSWGRDDIWARSLSFLEMPKLTQLSVETMFKPDVPLGLARFPLLVKVTLVGDLDTVVELAKPDALPISCTSLHLTDPSWSRLRGESALSPNPIPNLDGLVALGTTVPALHTLVLDNETQLHGSCALSWVRTFDVPYLVDENPYQKVDEAARRMAGQAVREEVEMDVRMVQIVQIVPNITVFRSRKTRMMCKRLLPLLRPLLHLQVVDVPLMAVNDAWLLELYHDVDGRAVTSRMSQSSTHTHTPTFPSLRRVSVRGIFRSSNPTSTSTSILTVAVNAGSPFRNENAEVLMT